MVTYDPNIFADLEGPLPVVTRGNLAAVRHGRLPLAHHVVLEPFRQREERFTRIFCSCREKVAKAFGLKTAKVSRANCGVRTAAKTAAGNCERTRKGREVSDK